MIAGKLDGTNDIDWSEIATISKLDIHPDSLRKAGTGIKLVIEAGMLSDGSSHQQQPTTYAEQQKIKDMRREINEHYRADARSEMLREAVYDAARKYEPMLSSRHYTTSVSNEKTLVVGVADCHYGADWEIKGLMGETINKYCPEIFEQRMTKLLYELAIILKKEQIDHVCLLMAGDSLDGMLRQNQLMNIRWGSVESCMRYAEFMAQWIWKLSAYANIDVYSVDGNHTETRPLGSKKGQFENENLEKIITWHLEARFEDIEIVMVHGPSEKYKLFDVCGYSFLLTHGDSVRDMGQLAKQAVLQYGRPIDFFVCGHRHSEQEQPSGKTLNGDSTVIRLPSICGVDGFALSRGYNGKPGATAMVIEKDYGRRCVYPIRID